jgi:hypothetical protein
MLGDATKLIRMSRAAIMQKQFEFATTEKQPINEDMKSIVKLSNPKQRFERIFIKPNCKPEKNMVLRNFSAA